MPLVPYKIVITIIYYLHLHLFHCFDYITKTENQKTFDHKFLLHLHLFLRFMCFGYSLQRIFELTNRKEKIGQKSKVFSRWKSSK